MPTIRDQALYKCRHLLSQVNRDRATQTYGCFDRRYWAWKLVDYPEATFQRNLYPLSWYLDQQPDENRIHLFETIKAGLEFALNIQHKDGSFDQAYPNEHSYGATAFLLPDLIHAYNRIADTFSENERSQILKKFSRSANFLVKSKELHGFISNHLAGAAYGLLRAFRLVGEPKFQHKSREIVNTILANQSEEGWFMEYDGADPGYQTLCMYYLAQIYADDPDENLKTGLEKSLRFLQYFVHPDGTFGGEYGSRRTEIFYPGGIALLANEFPLAAAIIRKMAKAIEEEKTITLADVDMGNTAPLLSNYIITQAVNETQKSNVLLPCETEIHAEFQSAGIAVHSTPAYYAVIGGSNGGVLKVYDKKGGKLFYDDCGILGKIENGRIISNQFTRKDNTMVWKANACETHSAFYVLPTTIPTALNYFLLRAANLSIMQIKVFNEWIKKLMVRLLLRAHDSVPLTRTRKIEFEQEKITISDRIEKTGRIQIEYLRQGIKFSSIHMASSRYFFPAQLEPKHSYSFDGEALDRSQSVTATMTIDMKNQTIVRKI